MRTTVGLLGACILVCLFVAFELRADEPQDVSSSKQVKLRSQQIQQRLDKELSSLLGLYKHLHAHPELSHEEEKTAARLAQELKDLGFDVTTKVGGHGIVGIFKNGDGPTIMVRTDMDALPVTERTDLPYASKVRAHDKHDKEGKELGVMHACGHDMHMACWVGTARVLTHLRDQWQGTLVFIGQPAEEVGAGARMMLADGLFTRFPRPDAALGLHCTPNAAYGHISYSEGVQMANVDTVTILVHGKGGHGAAPDTTIDPIVLSARIVLDLQTLVSREVKPGEPAVVTVGSIQGGSRPNIIPNEVKLQLTVRSLKDQTRDHLLKGIQRIAKAAADGARAPEPEIQVSINFTPALYNNPDLARKTSKIIRMVLGEDKVHVIEPDMGGEDFARYGRAGVPIFFYRLGTMSPERIEVAKRRGETLPSLHSDQYYPIPEPTLRTGVLTMSHAVLNLLAKRK